MNEKEIENFIELGDMVTYYGDEIDSANSELKSNLEYSLEKITDLVDSVDRSLLNESGISWIETIERAASSMQNTLASLDLDNDFWLCDPFDTDFLKPRMLKLQVELKDVSFEDPEEFLLELTNYVKFLVSVRGIGANKSTRVWAVEEFGDDE